MIDLEEIRTKDREYRTEAKGQRVGFKLQTKSCFALTLILAPFLTPFLTLALFFAVLLLRTKDRGHRTEAKGQRVGFKLQTKSCLALTPILAPFLTLALFFAVLLLRTKDRGQRTEAKGQRVGFKLQTKSCLAHTPILALFLALASASYAQFPPAAGQPGSTAIHKNSSDFVNWANGVHYFQRGASDIANGWSVTASYGDSTNALGLAEGNSFDIVSLGDSGVIVLSFPYPIKNEVGFDFAIFENSFSHDYLEFAFVEVSTDGIRYVRFPCTSLIPFTSQTGTYANSNTELVDNLAGKYIQGYGTPFDLELLIDSSGINLDSINYVKIVDVIGTINPTFASYDSQGNIINDPYPSDFESGGFDLDAVGVIHENNIFASVQSDINYQPKIYPNPATNFLIIEGLEENSAIQIFDLTGKIVFSSFSESTQTKIEFDLPTGFYILKCEEISIQIQIIH